MMFMSNEINPPNFGYEITVKFKYRRVFISLFRRSEEAVVQNADPLCIEFLGETFKIGKKKLKHLVYLRNILYANVNQKKILSERVTGKPF